MTEILLVGAQEAQVNLDTEPSMELTAVEVMCAAAQRFSQKFGIDTRSTQQGFRDMNLPGADIPVVPCSDYGVLNPENGPHMRHLWAY